MSRYITLLFFQLIVISKMQAQVVVPETIYVNQTLKFVSNIESKTHEWKIFYYDTLYSPQGELIDFPSGFLVRPNYIEIEKQSDDFIGLVTNDKEVSKGYISLLNFSKDLESTPVVTSLGDFEGLLNHPSGLSVVFSKGNWYAFLLNSGQNKKQFRMVRLDFGNSLLNKPKAVNLKNPVSFHYPFSINIIEHDGKYIGFFVDLTNNLFRMDFGSDIRNEAVKIERLGNFGNFKRSFKQFIFNDRGKWYMFLVNDDVNGGGSISLLSFGESLLNYPTGVNLGDLDSKLVRPGSIFGEYVCDHWRFYITSLTKPNTILLEYPNGMDSTFVSKDLGSLNQSIVSGGNSEVIESEHQKYLFYVNTTDNSLARCKLSNFHLINYYTTSITPYLSFAKSGVYFIQYTANKGLQNEYKFCKKINVDTIGNTLNINEVVLVDSTGKSNTNIDLSVVLKEVFYEKGKEIFNDESVEELNNVLIFLEENPETRVKISSHTDSRESFQYNMDLSQRRANNIVDWFIKHGISKERLIAKGYGESKILNRCWDGIKCSEEEHKENCRTEITILSGFFNLASFKAIQ
ncbi:MAG: OmpA family protein [Chitinophagales bacterium]|nr:OmpA family protein [Chitinophagales bacterium]